MSALTQIKGALLYQMKGGDKEVKSKIIKVINSIDNDLEIQGYRHSEDVDTALEELYNALANLDEQENAPKPEPDTPLTIERTKIPSRESADGDDVDGRHEN